MLHTTSPARRNPAKKFASAFAMAIALAGGAVVANAGFAPVAFAQDYTEAFVDAYQPVADVVNAEGSDIASVAAQFPIIVGLAQTVDDKFAVGNLLLIAGNKTDNVTMQRQGLELQLESGKVPAESVGQYYWFAGNLAFQQEDYTVARSHLAAAEANNWTQDDPTGLMAETYYRMDDTNGGIAFVLNRAQQRVASGGEVPEQWLLRGLQAAYNAELLNPAVELTAFLVTNHNTQRNWMNGLQVVNALHDLDDQAQLDLLRLMRTTETLSDRNEYIRYIESADPRIMSNEVVSVLGEGLAAGEFEVGGNYYEAVKVIVDQRMSSDRAEAPSMVADANADAGGGAALSAGDVLYSLNDLAGAEAMYAMAVSKGGIDANTALTRQGMMQALQGKAAEAQATLAQVSGPRSIVAKMWTAYAMTLGS